MAASSASFSSIRRCASRSACQRENSARMLRSAVSGCWPVVKNASQAWTLARASAPQGIMLALVATQLKGMRAARHAPALLASARALLGAGATTSSMLSTLQLELRDGAHVKAPASVICALLDARARTVQVEMTNGVSILRWEWAGGGFAWSDAGHHPGQAAATVSTLALGPDHVIVIFDGGLFDLLDVLAFVGAFSGGCP